ncbi:hypothetical protein KVT40_004971 [Elsinoe batatas]|uniref:DnaJ homologue subfamily C member 28 conserved domain-containing protein n=1 Tax=Elsinoe batatas TaxID=2601811 RepID=A0A8K0L854_9PEZI|nr:hypothetical protein KVT40_004971 [Elsinoe batatas]
MRGRSELVPYICSSCLRAAGLHTRNAPLITTSRGYRPSPPHRETQHAVKDEEPEKEQGAMSRRLAELTSESLETGGRSARKAVDEAGFSEDLKKQLEERIANAGFRSDNASAFAQAELRPSAGAGTRDIAGAAPWVGTESVEDAALRMLNDAHKPLKRPARPPGIRMPTKVDTGRSRTKGAGSGTRIANARDKTSIYSSLKDSSMTEEEREQMRKELKERFTPGARAVPATIQGLASLANERIEDAISRGQFKNLPRGKKIERDYNASSPFLDTTEYFMNKIIQRQEIVPPWIEKQQELVSTANRFRARLRSDWKRHVARTISSKGGVLQYQISLAEEYARAEAIENPPKSKEEHINTVSPDGQVSQISLSGELSPSPSGLSLASSITVSAQPVDATNTPSSAPPETITISPHSSPELVPPASSPELSSLDAPPPSSSASPSPPPPATRPLVPPFRDPSYLATELSYHRLAIDSLNALTRSYNLMAPNLAKKPYFNLERELRACYADVAPLVAGEIKARAARPTRRVEEIGHREGGVMERFAGGRTKVYDERKPRYGFREFWRDLFAKE